MKKLKYLYLIFFLTIVLNVNSINKLKEYLIYDVSFNKNSLVNESIEKNDKGNIENGYILNTPDSLLVKIVNELNEEDSLYYQYLNGLTSSDFINRKWGYPDSLLFLENYPDTSLSQTQIIYTKALFIEDCDYLFKKIKNNKIILYKDNSLHSDFLRTSKFVVDYKLAKDALFIRLNKKFIKLFDRVESINGIKNFYGKYFYNQHYDKIEFMGFLYQDVYEFYLIDLKSGENFLYLLWFDKEYNLIRIENINYDGVYTQGILYKF